jgi:hypothetical protein
MGCNGVGYEIIPDYVARARKRTEAEQEGIRGSVAATAGDHG